MTQQGRVDVRVFIGNASPAQIRHMFLRFYEGQDALADEFVSVLGTTAVSTAQLQGHFLFYKHDANAALENVASLIETVKK
jgi:chaperone BCS1